jgi:hypothetical protein
LEISSKIKLMGEPTQQQVGLHMRQRSQNADKTGCPYFHKRSGLFKVRELSPQMVLESADEVRKPWSNGDV